MAKPVPRRRTLREFVRVLFAHRPLIVSLVILGGMLAYPYGRTRTYQGNIELASAPLTVGSDRLPTVMELRRLVLDRDVLSAVLSPREAQDRESVRDVEQSLRIEPIAPAEMVGPGIWNLSLSIPAHDDETAAEQLQAYVNRIQSKFEAMATSAAPANDRTTSAPLNVEPVLRLVADEAPQRLQLPMKLAEDQAKWEEQVRALGLSPEDNLLAAIEETKKRIASLEEQNEIRRLEMQRASARLDALRQRIPATEMLPSALLVEGSPVLVRLRNTIRDMQAIRDEMAKAGQDVSALDRQINDYARRLDNGLSGLTRAAQERLDAARAEDDAGQRSLAEVRQRLRELVDLRDQQVVLERRRDRQREIPQKVEPALAVNEPSIGTAPPVAGVAAMPVVTSYWPLIAALKPGRVLVAGPFVNADPIGPNIVRSVLFGSLLGLALASVIMLIRTIFDQRIHVQDDIDRLNLDIEVLGSIPRVKSRSPVRLLSRQAR